PLPVARAPGAARGPPARAGAVAHRERRPGRPLARKAAHFRTIVPGTQRPQGAGHRVTTVSREPRVGFAARGTAPRRRAGREPLVTKAAHSRTGVSDTLGPKGAWQLFTSLRRLEDLRPEPVG